MHVRAARVNAYPCKTRMLTSEHVDARPRTHPCVVGQANEGRKGSGVRVWGRETRRAEGRLSLAPDSLHALPPCIACTNSKHTGCIGPSR